MKRFSPLTITLCILLAACSGATARKAHFIERGQQLMAARDYEKARLEFRNALQIDPKDGKLQHLAGTAAEKVGNYDEAAALYQAAITTDKSNLKAQADLARLYLFGGLPEQGQKLIDAGLAVAPTNADLLVVRGALRIQAGDKLGALADAEQAFKTAPGSENAASLLASLYSQSGRLPDAVRVVDQAIRLAPGSVDLRIVLAQLDLNSGRPEAAELQLLEVVKLEPANLAHRYRLAQFYLLQKNVDAAEQTLRKAVQTKLDDFAPKLALANLIAEHRSFEAAEKSLKDLIAQSSASAPLQLGLGQFYETHGRLSQAEAVYRGLIADQQTGPQGLTARNLLAAIQLRAHHSAEAAQLLEEVLAASPRDNEALVMRANLAIARGDAPAAITDLRAVLRDQPNAPVVLRGLARAYLVNKDSTLAEETLRQATQADPRDIATRLQLADLLIKGGKPEQAQPTIDQLVTDQPGSAQALEAAFRVQFARQDFAAARRSAAAIQTVDPKQPLGFYLAGLVDQAQGKLEPARANFEQALALRPDVAEPLVEAVHADIALKQADRAIARIEAVIARSPGNALAHNLKGEVLYSLKQYDFAIRSFNEAIRLAPQWWVPYRGVGAAEMAAGRMPAGITAYQRGIEASKGAPPLITELAGIYEQQAQPDKAIAAYEAWIARDPVSEVAANNLAMVLVTYRAKDANAMNRALQLANRFASSQTAAYADTYGWVRFCRGEFAEAIPPLQRAVSLAPSALQLRYHLGMAQYKVGQMAAAQQNLELAVAGKPDYAGVDDARRVLAALRQKA